MLATMKSDRTLRARIKKLHRLRINAAVNHRPKTPVSQLLTVVGDLTLHEIHRLVEIAVADHQAALEAAGL